MEIRGIIIEDFDDVMFYLFPHKIYLFYLWIKSIPVGIKRFYQRCVYGYDDTLYWNLGESIGEYIVKHLKAFGEIKGAQPCGMSGARWNRELKDIIEGIEFIISEDKYYLSSDEEYEEYNQKMIVAKTKAKKLIDYLDALWD